MFTGSLYVDIDAFRLNTAQNYIPSENLPPLHYPTVPRLRSTHLIPPGTVILLPGSVDTPLFITVSRLGLTTAQNTTMRSFSIHVVFVSLLYAICVVDSMPPPAKPCLGKLPIPAQLIGKSSYGSGGCSPGGSQSSSSLTIYNWGMFFSPLFYWEEGCREHIVIAYTKSNVPAMIYHRPLVSPEYFNKSHPALYKKFKNGNGNVLPCNTVPVNKVFVWKNRTLFVKLINSVASGLFSIRAQDCSAPGNYGDPNRKFSWKELGERIKHDRITTSAIAYVHSLAYSNYFCV